MGQRHQIFVKIANPSKHLRNEDKAQLAKEFGTGEFSILAYHNQWLYGRSALINCLALLNFGKQFTKKEKTTTKTWSGNNSPITPQGIESTFYTHELLTKAIGFVMNFRPVKTEFNDAGISNSFYIGKEDEGINHDFTMGDNNDGITIVDLVENKYCFMNIYEQREKSNSVLELPSLVPCNAKDYVQAYYGETVETINTYYTKDKTAKEIKEVLIQVKKSNKKVVKPFEEFEVLTLDEIGKMFSTMEVFKLRKEVDKIVKVVRKAHGKKIGIS